METINQKVRLLAHAKNITQKQISEHLGISRITTHRFFSGKTKINAEHFVKMIEFLGIPVTTVLDREIILNTAVLPAPMEDQTASEVPESSSYSSGSDSFSCSKPGQS